MTLYEIPSDETVCEVLAALGNASALQLVNALVDKAYDKRDTQRAIQRCLDRGKIVLGAGLRLSLPVSSKELVAA